ncbi:MAG: DNA-binding transcriptional ArsR family regulator [Candidatus Azotimanducaceae bacterium]|jgi:DNA-binding transcriptional ArsR family regulator
MARTKDRAEAIELRKKGMSYSQIKEKLSLSKSTLSSWLKDLPLSKERMKELRDNNQVRIEKTRETKRLKRELRRSVVYEKVSQDIRAKGVSFVSGFYLYWGEGTKTAEYTVALTNSDPAMVRCFVIWLQMLGVKKSDMRIKLHVYTDQDEPKLKAFWAKVLGISIKNFNKSYVKDSRSDRKTYKGMFPYGTCVVAYHDRDMREYVMAGIQYLRDSHGFAVK